MERIIEFPFDQWGFLEAFIEESELPQAYCVCYQYDVNVSGYGPYGFDTEKSKALLAEALEPLVFWNKTRHQFLNALTPNGSGLFFPKGQPSVAAMEREVKSYNRAMDMQKLRRRYGKETEEKNPPVKPLIMQLVENGKISLPAISKLIVGGVDLFIGYMDMNTGGLQLIFFDRKAVDKIKNYASIISVDYCLFESRKDLKPW
jgi:hypothetical protein